MGLSSRDRMLAAISCQAVDYSPCCFMQFTALERDCTDQLEMVDRLLDWGLDATVQTPPWLLSVPGDAADLRGLPVEYHPLVQVIESTSKTEGGRYATLSKDYVTPEGTLSVRVNQTDDWPYGDHVPFLDDFIIPRATKPLVTRHADLGSLRYLLASPSDKAIEDFREESRVAKEYARERALLVSGGLGVGADQAAWLCGLQEIIYLARDEPEFVQELLQIIADWNQVRMEIVLDEGVDLWVRRGWYEGSDFWSPRQFRRFILPHLKREAELAHGCGVKFGYILTSGAMTLLDMILEAGVDVLIGVDPVMGGADVEDMREKSRGLMCLWGGVSGALTVERGRPEDVREAVRTALELPGDGRGFILSPVDDVRDSSEHTWNNVQALVAAWKDWARA